MDSAQFTEKRSGKLVPLEAGSGPPFAFLPDFLPPEWSWPPDLWPTLVAARTALATLDGTGRHLASAELLMRPLQRREALRSSSLEGTYTEPEEQALFELGAQDDEPADDPTNAFREVNNYARALRIRQPSEPISLHLIRRLHATLLRGVRGSDPNPGSFRTKQNQIGKPPRFVPPPAHLLNDLLENLEQYIKSPRSLDPLVDAFVVHYQFEAIHPFMDGNGRVGRLLLALMIQEWCGLSGQWLYMSAYFDANKESYMDHMLRVSTEGAWSEWIAFCLRGVADQAQDALQRCDRLLALQQDFHERLRKDGEQKLTALVDSLFVWPAVRVADVQERLNVTYPTARKYLTRLEKLGILSVVPTHRPMSYVSRPVLEATFGD